MAAMTDVTWDAPGPGRWQLEVEHMSSTLTPLFREIWRETEIEGFKEASARYGAPMSHPELRFVNDWAYMRIFGLIETGRPDKAPPKPLLWLLVRALPQFRRREETARRMFAGKLWREEVEQWQRVQKPACIAANLALQDEDVSALDDNRLAIHLERAFENARAGSRLHFVLHGPDLFAPGHLLALCQSWGIPPSDVVPLLQGHSPASVDTVQRLRTIADELADAGVKPSTLEDVRSSSPAAAAALDEYLRLYGHRVVSGYDVDSLTLNELPELIVSSIANPPPRPMAATPEAVEAIRARVPADARPVFDDALVEARLTYGLRDDNVGITYMWPVGLLRRAVLDAARRLSARGQLQTAEHVFELSPDELVELVRGASAPSGPVVALRADRRARNERRTPPPVLGPEEPDPPLDLLTPALAKSGAAVLAYATAMFTAPSDGSGLRGTGIGNTPYRGRARVAASAAEAIARLEPGDVLVSPFTTPAFNAVLPIAGGLVVEEGGALSHAAIVARELGIPAVIGATGARKVIRDGITIEIDPAAGLVTLIAAD